MEGKGWQGSAKGGNRVIRLGFGGTSPGLAATNILFLPH